MALNLSTCIVGGIEPVQLSLTNNRISFSSAASSRGIAFSIGADSQLFSVSPILNDNNTCLTLTDSCVSRSNASCVAYHGGVYTPAEGVQVTAEPANWNGTPTSWLQQGDTDGYDDLFFNDVMRIAGYNIPGLPIYTYTDIATGEPGFSSLPLGVNSSFLEAALDVGMIGTKQWSLWTGSADDNIDGHLTLGGYDEARVTGEFTMFEVNYDFKLPYIQVTGIAWEGSDLGPVDLMPNDTNFIWALPEPFWLSLNVPEETYFKFVDVANSTGDAILNSSSNYHQFYNLPSGDIIITLNNGMKTTIPVRELFHHPQDYDANGVFQVLNDSYYVNRLWWSSGQTNDYYFGLPFMNQKMFVADWDSGKFYMADAVKDAEATPNVQPLCTPTTEAPPPPSPPPTTPVVSPSPSPHPDSGPNVAAIAGGVGGGVGGLLVIGLIAWFVLRKRKKNKQQGAQEFRESPYPVSSPPPKYASGGIRPVSETGETYYSPHPQHNYSPSPQHNYSPSPQHNYSPSPQHMPPEMASPPHSPEPQTASHMQNQARSEGTSSDYWVENPVGPANHADRTFPTLSGPLEMPTEYEERPPR